MTAMNYSTSIFLVNDAVRAVMVSYEGRHPETKKPVGALTMFKTFDTSIKVDDFVIVPTGTRCGMTVCQVEEVDVDVDPASSVQVDWIVDVVDRAAYEATVARERSGIQTIKSAEKRRAKDELIAAIMKDNPELAALSDVGSGPALPAPEAPPRAPLSDPEPAADF